MYRRNFLKSAIIIGVSTFAVTIKSKLDKRATHRTIDISTPEMSYDYIKDMCSTGPIIAILAILQAKSVVVDCPVKFSMVDGEPYFLVSCFSDGEGLKVNSLIKEDNRIKSGSIRLLASTIAKKYGHSIIINGKTYKKVEDWEEIRFQRSIY